jgi:hypothetical protein
MTSVTGAVRAPEGGGLATKGTSDFTAFLWLLKLGTLANLYFMLKTAGLPGPVDADLALPAQILFAVCAYRCLFPVRYEHNVVLHDSPVSSILATRLLATFAEVGYIFLFSHVLRLLNVVHLAWVDALSWLMVAQVVVSQGFVWVAVVTGNLRLYWYEELGWAVIFVANTAASALLMASAAGSREILLELNLAFGALYLPWQMIHLRTLWANAARERAAPRPGLRARNRRTDAESWGGLVGLTWMTGYWIGIPAWVCYIVDALSVA